MADTADRFPQIRFELPMQRPVSLIPPFPLTAPKSATHHLNVVLLGFLALYLTLPNLPLLLASGTLSGLPHGYLNVECLAIGAVGLFLPRQATFALLLIESILDFAYSLCYTYRFTLGDLVSSLRYLTTLPTLRLIEGLAVLLLCVLLSAILAIAQPRPHMRRKAFVALLACAALATGIDVVDGQNFLWRKDATLTPYRLVRSPMIVLAMWQLSSLRVGADARAAENRPMDSASAGLVPLLDRESDNSEAPNVVLILVESWGLQLDPHLASALTEPFADPGLADRYQVSSGTAPFSGLTIPGEARELCHSTAGFAILNDSSSMAARCLPAQFHAHGYENFAVHGFLGQMFYRSKWYPQLGFDQTWFRPDLEKLGLPDCPGAFPGTCDTSIAEWLGRMLQTPAQKPRFIYWVTLNSHLPEPAHPSLADDGVCATEPQLRASTALCSWFRIVRAEHQAVEETAMLPTPRPTVFILVGDHAPPFSSPELRARFSSTDVPFEMLIPKTTAPRQASLNEQKDKRD